MHFLLFYDYGENAVERRAPYRQEHLTLARQAVQRGELVLAGAYADPLDGAALVFEADDVSVVERFVAKDPYVASGLVTGWRIRAWAVVVGSGLDRQPPG